MPKAQFHFSRKSSGIPSHPMSPALAEILFPGSPCSVCSQGVCRFGLDRFPDQEGTPGFALCVSRAWLGHAEPHRGTIAFECRVLATSIPAWMEKGSVWRFSYLAASFPRSMTVSLGPPLAVPIKQEVATPVFPSCPQGFDVHTLSGDCGNPPSMIAGVKMPIIMATNENWEAGLTECLSPC